MTDGSKALNGKESEPADKRGRRATGAGGKVKAGANAVRSRIATLVWLVAVVCALFLAIGALLMALNAKEDNTIVEFVTSGANFLDGPFHDLFDLEKQGRFDVKDALVNWGIAAVVYLVVGKVLDRVIRP